MFDLAARLSFFVSYFDHILVLAFDSIKAVEDRLEEARVAYEKDWLKVQSIAGFEWIIVEL